MTAREYLSQADRLEQRIVLLKDEIEALKEVMSSVSSPGLEEHYNATRNTDAPFVKTVEKLMEYQEELVQKVERLVCLKREITCVINQLENKDEQIVLTYRYIKNYTWSQIGEVLHADERTIRRWHDRALTHVSCP